MDSTSSIEKGQRDKSNFTQLRVFRFQGSYITTKRFDKLVIVGNPVLRTIRIFLTSIALIVLRSYPSLMYKCPKSSVSYRSSHCCSECQLSYQIQ